MAVTPARVPVWPRRHYIIGSAVGPHPFPTIVKELQSVIGREARAQMLEQAGKLPDHVVACVGGGSNAIGTFAPFADDAGVKLYGAEAGGEGLGEGVLNSATLSLGTPGVLHGARTYVLQDAEGQTAKTSSISAGLDYPGVGPEHAYLKDTGRAEYRAVTDAEAQTETWTAERAGDRLCHQQDRWALCRVQLRKETRKSRREITLGALRVSHLRQEHVLP